MTSILFIFFTDPLKEYIMDKLENLFENCLKPGRYVGSEYNSVHRDWDKSELKVVLAFPDTYEIGQSGLGLKIIAEALLKNESYLVERVFAPWIDLEEKLREEKISLFSLESRKPIKEFDLLGITLPYEMCYTNILSILSLSDIPFLSSERGEGYPIIIGGGACTFNPEPVADFFDILLLGDGEESVVEVANLLRDCKKTKKSKAEFLQEASKIQGAYVPSFYEPIYAEDGSFVELKKTVEYAPDFIEKRTLKSLDDAVFPVNPPVPFTETIHDRIMLEIARGCTRGCRFCQASMYYRPVRERSKEKILELLEKSINATGYEEVSLSSLSCTDHSMIAELISEIQTKYEEKYVELSLPSIRTDAFSVNLAKLVQKFRRTSLTFAPEVGTEKMRNVVNKGSSEDDVIEIAKECKKAGWNSLKLYFLTGLPFEEESDIDGIIDLIWKVLKSSGLKLTISFSSFVPKPQTPFQWAKFVSIPETVERQAKLKRKLKHGKITMKFHVPELSFLEAVFAKGDRRLSKVLVEAYKNGCKFDGWTDCFKFDKWMESFANCSIDPNFYTKEASLNDRLPWEHLMSKTFSNFLKTEFVKASQQIVTPDCRFSCNGCGVCKDGVNPVIGHSSIDLKNFEYKDEKDHSELECSGDSIQKFRIKYKKGKESRLTSHLDMLRAFQRIIRRANLPVAYTRGFHPRMKLVPGHAIGLGAMSNSEWMDLDLREKMTVSDVFEKLTKVTCPGIEILEIREVPLKIKAVTEIANGAIWNIYFEKEFESEKAKSFCKSILNSSEIKITRKDKEVDIRTFISDLYFDEKEKNMFVLDSFISHQGTVRPSEIAKLIIEKFGQCDYYSVKDAVYCLRDNKKIEPWG